MAKVRLTLTASQKREILAGLTQIRDLIDRLITAVDEGAMEEELAQELHSLSPTAFSFVQWLRSAQERVLIAGSHRRGDDFTEEQRDFCRTWNSEQLALFRMLLKKSSEEPRKYFTAASISIDAELGGSARANQIAGKFLSSAARLGLISRTGRATQYRYRAAPFTFRFHEQVTLKIHRPT